MLCASVASKAPGKQRAGGAARDRGEQPRKPKTKRAPRRRAPHLGNVKAERLEDFVTRQLQRFRMQPGRRVSGLFGFVRGLQEFFGEKTHVHDADDPFPGIHHGKREEFVEHEKLARLQHGDARRDGHDAPDHDVVQRRVQRRDEQPARRQHADQSVGFIHDVEINEPFAGALATDGFERPGDSRRAFQQRKIKPRVGEDRIAEMLGGRGGIGHGPGHREAERSAASSAGAQTKCGTVATHSHRGSPRPIPPSFSSGKGGRAPRAATFPH